MSRAVLSRAVGLLLVLAGTAVAMPTSATAGPSGSLLPADRRVAPALAGVDPITDKQVSLARWAGKPLLVNLWGSWCHPCRDEARELGRFLLRHPGSVLGIDVEDSKAGARAFARTYGVRFPSIFDPVDRLAHKLGAVGTPTTYFLDRRDRIVAAVYAPGRSPCSSAASRWRTLSLIATREGAAPLCA